MLHTNTLTKRIRRGSLTRGQAGMTLVEIMVVMTLLGLLMTILAVNFLGMAENRKVDAALLQMETIKGRLDAFKLEYQRYPSTSEGLNALVTPPQKSNGRTPAGYLDDATLLADPWGNPLQYYAPARTGDHAFEIVSLGSDGQQGGENTDMDISNWQR